MAFPTLRNRPLTPKWAKIWSFADIPIQLISSIVLIIHFIFQQEAMMLFMGVLSILYFGLLCMNHKHLYRLTQYRIYILAHSKNLVSFINIIAFIYLSARALYASQNIQTSMLYFMVFYIALCIYNIIAWIISFMLLGSVEQTQPFKGFRGDLYLDYYPVIYSKGKTLIMGEYSPDSDWVTTRGINRSNLSSVKPIPNVQKNVPEMDSMNSMNQPRGGQTFTTMNSDTRPPREGDQGISMGSRVSDERRKIGFRENRTQRTNLVEETRGTVEEANPRKYSNCKDK